MDINNSLARMAVALTVITLSGCTGVQQGQYAATQNLPPNMRSTEGRLFTREGVVVEQRGVYYLSGSRGSPLYRLTDPDYAARFLNEPVNVTGFFNYDAGTVDVRKISPIAPVSPKR